MLVIFNLFLISNKILLFCVVIQNYNFFIQNQNNMSNLFVACNNCDSSLQIDEEIAFVTCRDCEKTLEIVRTFNSVYTKVRETQTWEIPTEIIYPSTEIDKNEIYKEIALLDKEWKNQLPNFMKNGKLPNQDISLNAIFLFLGIAFSIFCLILTSSLFWFVIIAFITFIFIRSFDKKEAYKTAKLNYEEKRAALMERLNE